MNTQQMPPQTVVLQLLSGRFLTEALGVVAKLGVADLLASGPESVEVLASRTDVHAPSLYRVMRALSMAGVFTETEPKTFGLTPAGEMLRSTAEGSMLGIALWLTSPIHYRCWGDLEYCVKTGEPASDHVLGMPVFDYFESDPATSTIFNNAMTSLSAGMHAAIVEAYDFSDVKTLVDVGGGHGGLLSDVIATNPGVHGIVFDLPAVVAGAPSLLAARGVSKRCEAVGGNFFESVPAGDAYILSSVLHDWDDERAAIILNNCRKSMNPGGKVLVVDSVIPPGDAPYPGKIIDLEMLVMTSGGRERTAEEFVALFATAGLKVNRIVATRSYECVIEGVVR